MAFDGITVSCIVKELSDQLTGGRIYKIAQTENDELLITVRQAIEKGRQKKLFMSADASLPLIYMSEEGKTSPLTAPGFCMLLRKRLQNGKILSITQPGLERIVRLSIEHMDELGDMKSCTLLIELMGKYSNIIFTNENDQIIDSIKHIPSSVSSVREVLPGRDYFIPQTQNKEDPFSYDVVSFCAAIQNKPSTPVYKAIYGSYTGFSPLISQEICFRTGIDSNLPVSVLTGTQTKALFQAFSQIMEQVKSGLFSPAIIYSNGQPSEYSCIPLTMYDNSPDCTIRKFDSISELLADYYAEKNAVTRIRQKSSDLRHIVSVALERAVRKYDLQTNQLKDTQKKDKYRLYGELLTAYGYSIPAGSPSAIVNDYNTGKDITIKLDTNLTISENSQRFFDRYTKLKRTEEALTTQTAETSAEINHLRSIETSLDIARQEDDLRQISQELEDCGYIRKKTNTRSKKERFKSQPFHYVTSGGFDIYVGKNNYQNDELTFKFASGGDWWFHAKKMPGSHCILHSEGKAVPDRDFEEAAALAAYYSSGREQLKVDVDYLLKKNVKKPGGSKPGFVVYYTNYSMTIAPDISGIKQIP